MFKKITAFLLALLVSTNSFADYSSGNYKITTNVVTKSSTLHSLLKIPGLAYFKDFSNTQTLVADYPAQAPNLNFESNYDSTHPATYYDSNGLEQTTTTNDTPRYTYGYYDESGFVNTGAGLLIDGAHQNLAARSGNFSTFWTNNNITVGSESVTLPSGSTGTTNTLTAAAADATIRATTTVGSAAREFSVKLKRKTGTGDIQLSLDNTTFKTVTINSSTWTRVWVRQTGANPIWTIRIRTAGDAIYADGVQVIGYPYSASYVPTTTATLSKTADVLSLPTSNILSGTASTVLMQFISLSDENQNGSNAAALFDTDSKSTLLQLNSNVYPIRFQPNATDTSGALVTSYASITKNNKFTVAAVSYGDTVATNSTVYVNGTEQLASTTNYTAPVYGTNMYFGANNASARQPAIIIKKIAIYNRALTSAEIGVATSALGGSWEALTDTRPKILTLGDSITNGTGQTNTWGYRAYLQALINPAVSNVRTARTYQFVGPYRNSTLDDDYELFHAGVSGERTDQLALRLPTHLRNYMSGTLPSGSKALIHIGTNDITSGVAEATIVNNIEAMIDVIHAFNPAIDVYVALIIPRLDADDADTTTFNAALKTMLDTKRLTKTNLYYVDMNARWKANASWATDYIAAGSPWLNVHPLDLGYSVMADGWYACINSTTAQYCNGN